ncbi:MAG: hypothetical protein ABIX46_00100 [Burkholderiaceae bacterium]
MGSGWPAPTVGDLVWCWFPQAPHPSPGPKARPALVVGVETRDDGVVVKVVYGTSQRLDRMKVGEFSIVKSREPVAFALSGLAYDTKFDFKIMVDLPWSDEFFKEAPRPAHGRTPKLGTLHPALLRAARAAYEAAEGR